LGFQAIQTGYWPVTFILDEALQLGKLFTHQNYIYYEKSDLFPKNGGNWCGSMPAFDQ